MKAGFTLLLFAYLATVVAIDLMRCTHDDDCPRGGLCFRDECARCLCPEGFYVMRRVESNTLTKICTKPAQVPLRIGDACERKTSRKCPHGSYCDPLTAVCVCEDGLRPHTDSTHCRKGIHAERCTLLMGCEEDLGLRCKGREPRKCKCQASHHRPSPWTRYVLKRWNYDKVEGEPQQCVARAVGEPCNHNRDCDAVEGSGAVCNTCGFCECRIKTHVPDVLGTKCGLGLGPGRSCTTVNPPYDDVVCDGTRGLQCGNVCDLYTYSTSPKSCQCSQMHDSVGGECLPKKKGSPCSTDLDCYPVREGFGYCDRGRCEYDAKAAGHSYIPHLSHRTCKPPIESHPDRISSYVFTDTPYITHYRPHYYPNGTKHNNDHESTRKNTDDDVLDTTRLGTKHRSKLKENKNESPNRGFTSDHGPRKFQPEPLRPTSSEIYYDPHGHLERSEEVKSQGQQDTNSASLSWSASYANTFLLLLVILLQITLLNILDQDDVRRNILL